MYNPKLFQCVIFSDGHTDVQSRLMMQEDIHRDLVNDWLTFLQLGREEWEGLGIQEGLHHYSCPIHGCMELAIYMFMHDSVEGIGVWRHYLIPFEWRVPMLTTCLPLPLHHYRYMYGTHLQVLLFHSWSEHSSIIMATSEGLCPSVMAYVQFMLSTIPSSGIGNM